MTTMLRVGKFKGPPKAGGGVVLSPRSLPLDPPLYKSLTNIGLNVTRNLWIWHWCVKPVSCQLLRLAGHVIVLVLSIYICEYVIAGVDNSDIKAKWIKSSCNHVMDVHEHDLIILLLCMVLFISYISNRCLCVEGFISPGHTLRCCTPAMVCSKGTAMPKNRMRCAVIKSSTCSIFCYWVWNISAIYYPIVKRISVLWWGSNTLSCPKIVS